MDKEKNREGCVFCCLNEREGRDEEFGERTNLKCGGFDHRCPLMF